MGTRIDEVHGYQYATQRVVNALTRLDADPPVRGPRNLALTLVGGMIAALVAVGILVFNTITGQSGPLNLRDSSTVLIEKESGAQFVYTKSDGQLHPVLNYSSGLLLAEGSGAVPTTVRRDRLASLRRDANITVGATLGIPDAPDAVPRPADLTNDAWSVCTSPGGGGDPQTSLLIGENAVTGGHQLVGPQAGSAGEALLVQAPDRSAYVVFGNAKFLIRDPAVVLAAFGWTGKPRQPVTAGWINAMPSGPDLVTPPVEGLREQSRAVDDTVGRLYRAPGPAGDQWAVVQRDGVRPISEVEARLLGADPRARVGEPVEVSTADFAQLTSAAEPLPAPSEIASPTLVPALLTLKATACIRVPDAATGVSAVIVDPRISSAAPVPARSAGLAETVSADTVSVPFGRGVLVRAAASPSAPISSGSVSLLADNGVMYPIADNSAIGRLGYSDRVPLAMPAALVDLLPSGPVLSTAAAARTPG